MSGQELDPDERTCTECGKVTDGQCAWCAQTVCMDCAEWWNHDCPGLAGADVGHTADTRKARAAAGDGAPVSSQGLSEEAAFIAAMSGEERVKALLALAEYAPESFALAREYVIRAREGDVADDRGALIAAALQPGLESRRTLPGHPTEAGAGYECHCGGCLSLPARGGLADDPGPAKEERCPETSDGERELACHYDAGHSGNHYDGIKDREWYLDSCGVAQFARPCTSCVYLGVPSPSPATRDDDLCDPCRAHFQAQPDEPDERGWSEYHAEEFALERGEDPS